MAFSTLVVGRHDLVNDQTLLPYSVRGQWFRTSLLPACFAGTSLKADIGVDSPFSNRGHYPFGLTRSDACPSVVSFANGRGFNLGKLTRPRFTASRCDHQSVTASSALKRQVMGSMSQARVLPSLPSETNRAPMK